MKKLRPYSIMAQKHGIINHICGINISRNIHTAKGMVYEQMMKTYPPEEGWFNHSMSVDLVGFDFNQINEFFNLGDE